MTDHLDLANNEARHAHRERAERVNTLFDAIKHGDAEHQRWLKKAIEDHFAGRVVERPSGMGSKERIAELEAEVEQARASIGKMSFASGDALAEEIKAREAAEAKVAELEGEVERVAAENRTLRNLAVRQEEEREAAEAENARLKEALEWALNQLGLLTIEDGTGAVFTIGERMELAGFAQSKARARAALSKETT